MINVFEPDLGTQELEAIARVFESKWLGRGSEVENFEMEFADHLSVGRQHVCTTTSCTEALFQVLELIGRPGASVVLPTVSFVGAANAVVAAGMRVVFCDVDPATGNVTLPDVTQAVSEDTIAVLVQHFGGFACAIEEIAEFCKSNELYLIEDSAGAADSIVSGTACGTFGDFGVWSLDAMKTTVAGDGGVIYGADLHLMSDLRRRLYLGLTAESGVAQAQHSKRWWEFDVAFPGRRAVMNDVTAAMARVQLQRSGSKTEVRRANAAYYDSFFSSSDHPIRPVTSIARTYGSSHYFYPILVQEGHRDSLALFLMESGIYTTFRYYPLHNIALYESSEREFPGADDFASRMLLLPQHSGLVEKDLRQVTQAIASYFSERISV